jgi:hypothetical protein
MLASVFSERSDLAFLRSEAKQRFFFVRFVTEAASLLDWLVLLLVKMRRLRYFRRSECYCSVRTQTLQLGAQGRSLPAW